MAKTAKPDFTQVKELLLQALETERGGIQVYTAAIKAALVESKQAHRAAERHEVSGQMPRHGIRGQGWRTGHRQQQTQIECGIQVFGQGVGVADPPEIGAQHR